ncbi:adhesin [Serratia marcescens]|nr:adhesin [Serratia marcescens]
MLAPGLGIIPRASGSATFGLYAGGTGTLTGTIGLPETAGKSSTDGNISDDNSYKWCLAPTNFANFFYYKRGSQYIATMSGTWVIIADGSQKNSEISLLPMYFGSYPYGGDNKTVQIFPSNLTLRISTLECTVNTPRIIDFGTVMRDIRPDAELASRSVPLITTCGQPSNFINANINVQFRALTGQYEGAPSRLALKQGGGYITGEIDNAATGSGACTSTSGVSFDSKPIKLGQISSAESSKALNNQVTWRLCSGGRSLPTGAVDAAAELLVTFN